MVLFPMGVATAGRILLKGDCITLIQKANPDQREEMDDN